MYHVNPITGEFGVCHASCPENCPFGVANHSETYEEIQIKADKINKQLNKYKTKNIKEAILTKEIITDIVKKIYRNGYNLTLDNEDKFNKEIDKSLDLSYNNLKFYINLKNNIINIKMPFKKFTDKDKLWIKNHNGLITSIFDHSLFNKKKLFSVTFSCDITNETGLYNCILDIIKYYNRK